jgi:transcriptional regulator with XRE-family HTH domain
MDTPGERLKRARQKARFSTATDAARAHGWVVSTYLGHENGDRIPSRTSAKRYAKAFQVTWDWLLEGSKAGSLELADIKTIGCAGTGTEVELTQDPVPHKFAAIDVGGDALYPRYFDGERIFIDFDGGHPSRLVGQECVVKLGDGRVKLRVLRRGSSSDRYNLESWCASPIEDVEVVWAAPVMWKTSSS